MRARVIENDNLERDLKSGAIINTSTSAYNHALQRRRQQKIIQAEKQRMYDEMAALRAMCECLQSQIDELKKLI